MAKSNCPIFELSRSPEEFMSNLPPRRYDEAAQKLANVVDDEEW